ncbi:DUF3429 domain-containing protein [Rhodovulum adriaticum]|uniref:Uncharacterized protein DUF3429 n=1 Tax=Rhodovulum adriaticum TaxID=35804 RepID=A0A4R2NZ41_RHOAD|nr:DUF3429 domain-containing protein [Rhodovulum adriaticum]MBK1634956.1 DUF3429 domain-containing protein [Rhodovulum adriaticum]TCP27427.1 uncharacterized protein DUF3429 [Rhodovulum adriaticum]
MTAIPRAALILGLAGLIPFLWGAATVLIPSLDSFSQDSLGPRFTGIYVLNFYGTIILAFMSGVLWGFATRAQGWTIWPAYALSVVPALWAFFMVGGGPEGSIMALIWGYGGLLVLDAIYWALRLAPRWWLALRLPLTAIVAACLSAALL